MAILRQIPPLPFLNLDVNSKIVLVNCNPKISGLHHSILVDRFYIQCTFQEQLVKKLEECLASLASGRRRGVIKVSDK